MPCTKSFYARMFKYSRRARVALMTESKLRQIVLPVFLMVFALLALTGASAIELTGGWQAISITEDMVGKSFSQPQLKDTCDVVIAWGVYDTKRQAPPTEWLRLHWKDDSRTITKDAVGYGLWLYTPKNSKCDLNSKGYAEFLGKASKLNSGWNFISVSKGMLSKSFDAELKGTCGSGIEDIMIYSPEVCKLTRKLSDPEAEGICDDDFLIIGTSEKLREAYLGKGLWVWAQNDCTLDDGTPSEALCNEKECAAKSGCSTNEYVSYGCQNKECTAMSARECTEAEKEALKGVNLMPVLLISPSTGLKSGDSVEVTFSIKNTGSKPATQYDMSGTTTISNAIYFSKEKESGTEVIKPIYADVNVVLDGPIKAGGTRQLAKQTVKIPEDFSGDLVVAAVVDTQSSYPETNENDNDNKQITTLSVSPKTKPDLAPTGIETSITSLDTLPVAIGPVFITVENKGELPAYSTPSMENRITIFKGDAEICRATAKEPMIAAIGPGGQRKFALDPRFITQDTLQGSECSVDDITANYRAVVEIDLPQLGAQGKLLQEGVIAESNEDNNKQTFAITARSKCSPIGTVQAGQYCDISSGTWQNQKESGRQCSHNFECKTELCIKQKCVSEKQKGDILKLLGISY